MTSDITATKILNGVKPDFKVISLPDSLKLDLDNCLAEVRLSEVHRACKYGTYNTEANGLSIARKEFFR